MKSQRWALFFLSLGVGMVIVNSTIINVAMPTMIKTLNMSSIQAQWVQEIYTLVFASTLLIFGKLADKIGRRKIFEVGLITFFFACLFATQINSPDLLIVARIFQGLGAAMMLPSAISTINSQFTGASRGKAFALWGSVIAGTAALGPFLGGWLITSFTWRWAFGVNLLLIPIVAVGVYFFVREERGSSNSKFDLLGSALILISGLPVIFALTEGRVYGWWKPIGHETLMGLGWISPISIIPMALIAGVSAFLIFIRLELKRDRAGKDTYIDLSIFRIRSFRYATFAGMIISLGEYGLIFLLPYWLQNVLGYSGFKTGTLFLILAIGAFASSSAGRYLSARKGGLATLKVGILLEIAGVGLLGILISPSTNVSLIAGCLFLYGIGIGLTTSQVTNLALRDIPIEKGGQASGISSALRQFSFALGIAILGSSLFGLFGSNLDHRLETLNHLTKAERVTLVHGVVNSAGTVIPELAAHPKTKNEADASIAALTLASKWSALLATIFLILGWLATWQMGRKLKSLARIPPKS